jgi:hypothetical protein
MVEGSENIFEPSWYPQSLKMKALCFIKIAGKINPVTTLHLRRLESATSVDKDLGNMLKCLKQRCGSN